VEVQNEVVEASSSHLRSCPCRGLCQAGAYPNAHGDSPSDARAGADGDGYPAARGYAGAVTDGQANIHSDSAACGHVCPGGHINIRAYRSSAADAYPHTATGCPHSYARRAQPYAGRAHGHAGIGADAPANGCTYSRALTHPPTWRGKGGHGDPFLRRIQPYQFHRQGG